MTEPSKGAVGLTGFPTPDNPTDMEAYLLFYFPDPLWAQYVLGACKSLQYPYNWFKSGEMSVDDAAEAFRIIVQDAPYNLLDPTVPTPFWDDETGDDADDEMPKEAQPWYGQLQIIDDELTFVENAFIWVVAGIIVYAGLPLAAIQFVPLAQKFVVTVKKNPLGGVIRFLADAVEIGRVDTYSATDVASEVQIVMPAAMGFMAFDAPVFWIELLEDNPHELASVSMTVMRSRLSENDFSPTNLRYNSDCDCVQYSPDGGETWVDDPGDDPRTSTKFLKPLKTGDDVKCRSAASMVMWLRNFIEYETEILTAGAEVTALANAALTLFDVIAPWAVLIQLLIEVAGTIFGIGSTALIAAFAGDEWDTLLCIFYCRIASDGSIDDVRMFNIQNDITEQLNTTAALILNLILQTQGVVGLQNAGTLYEVEDPDCSGCGCGWCRYEDFALSDGGYSISAGEAGSYSAGTGWVGGFYDANSVNEIVIEKTFTATEINYVAMHYNKSAGAGANNSATIRLFHSGSLVFTTTQTTNGSDVFMHTDVADIVADRVQMFINTGTASGSTAILNNQLEGNGTNPLGGDNC